MTAPAVTLPSTIDHRSAAGRIVMTCPSCGASPCINSSFCRICLDADRCKGQGEQPVGWHRWRGAPEHIPSHWDSMSIDALWHAFDLAAYRRNPAPERSTVAAIIHAVREHGLAALKEPATAERLARCTADQRRDIRSRIVALKQQNAIGRDKPAIDEATKTFMTEMKNDPDFQRIWQPAVRKFHGGK
jgi:hypothetical protein